MNSNKNSTGFLRAKMKPKARAICGASALAIVAAFTPASAFADSPGASGYLSFANAMKNVYKTAQTSSTTAASQQTMNQQAMSDPLCNQLIKAKTSAAQDYVKNKIPPDPTTAIQNSSCFLDVMDIAIPTSGNGFLDSVIGAVSPFLKASSCAKTTNWWNDNKTKMQSGQFGSLGTQFSGAISAVQSANPNGTVQSYSNLISGASARPATAAYVAPTTTAGLALPGNVQNTVNQSVATNSNNAQVISQVNAITGTAGTLPNLGYVNNGGLGVQANLTNQISTLRQYLGLP